MFWASLFQKRNEDWATPRKVVFDVLFFEKCLKKLSTSLDVYVL